MEETKMKEDSVYAFAFLNWKGPLWFGLTMGKDEEEKEEEREDGKD